MVVCTGSTGRWWRGVRLFCFPRALLVGELSEQLPFLYCSSSCHLATTTVSKHSRCSLSLLEQTTLSVLLTSVTSFAHLPRDITSLLDLPDNRPCRVAVHDHNTMIHQSRSSRAKTSADNIERARSVHLGSQTNSHKDTYTCYEQMLVRAKTSKVGCNRGCSQLPVALSDRHSACLGRYTASRWNTRICPQRFMLQASHAR